MPELTLKTVIRTQGNVAALKDGTVRPRGCVLAFEDVDPLIAAFRRMVRGLQYDVCEMAITTYLAAREHGKRFTAIPVFLVRAFHHGAIAHNVNAGIRTPKDLEGRRVGVNRGYTVTTGVWARSVLQNQYGVDLTKITWVLSGDEHVAEYRPPGNVVPIEAGRDMAQMLVSGELPAAIGIEIHDPVVQPLIPNAQEAGLDALRQRGHYPINHTIVVRDERLDAHPELGRNLFDAFAQAKRLYLDRLATGKIERPTHIDELHRRVTEMAGDPLPYGIEPNRRVLQELIDAALDQGIIAKRPALQSLFAPSTHELVA